MLVGGRNKTGGHRHHHITMNMNDTISAEGSNKYHSIIANLDTAGVVELKITLLDQFTRSKKTETQRVLIFRMPLVVICGYPSSGKSTWAEKLAEYLRTGQGKTVHIVKEEDHFRGEKNDILDDSRKEKELRAKVKSEAQRLLTKDDVVIVDSLNYIKGYRYELFCMSKAVPTRQVTVHCDVSEAQAWEWNLGRPDVKEHYKRNVFDHLIQRFETPDPQNRWDSPFFSVLSGEELDLNAIFNSLYFNKAPKRNMSTQSNPLSGANYLATMEKVTSEIIQTITTAQKDATITTDPDEFREIEVPHSKISAQVNKFTTVNQLNKLKRQFISLSKTSSLKGELGEMFVQYLNSQLNST